MHKLEIQAYDLDEAKLKAYEKGITVVADATNAWKRHRKPMLTKELNIFVADFMNKREMFDFENAGIIICLTTGRSNTKLHPGKIIKHKRHGRCNLNRTVEIRKKSDDSVVAVTSSKMKAYELAKKVIKKHKEDLYAKTVYVSTDIDFEVKYTPSSKTRLGQYLVFAADELDVNLNKKKNRGGY